MDNGSAGTVILGLDGLVLLAVSERDGELEQAVETTATAASCSGCGAAASPHARRPVWVRDLPAGGRPVTLVWVKRVWRCHEPACRVRTWTEQHPAVRPRSSWTEQHPAVRPRSSWTERARVEACRRVGQDGHSVAQVATAFGVGWATLMAAVRDHGTPLVEDPARLAGVRAVGVDETAFLKANAHRHTTFVTGIVDIDSRRLLDIAAGRSGPVLAQWITAQTPAWRAGVTVASLDPFRGYATALSATLPHATRVLDTFHVIKLGFTCLDDVRRRVQQDTHRHRGRTGDPLYGIRRVQRRGADTLSGRAWDRLLIGLAAGDPDGQVTAAWIAAQDLRLLYRAPDRARAEELLYRLLVHCADAGIPELARLARTRDAWRTELLAVFDHRGVSNGPTEAINLIIKKIKRVGHGFRYLNNYRLRLLLHCGVDWHTAHPTPLRARSPRLAA